MRQFISVFLCLVLAADITGCAKSSANPTNTLTEKTVSETTESTEAEPDITQAQSLTSLGSSGASADTAESNINDSGLQDNNAAEGTALKLFINGSEVPVIWENCAAIDELTAAAGNDDIVVAMSMYGGWEQVGALGSSYTREDRQMTAENGDIVLYNGNQIVIFYGSNSWSYTRLGRLDLSEDEVTQLLSNGDVTLTLSD